MATEILKHMTGLLLQNAQKKEKVYNTKKCVVWECECECVSVYAKSQRIARRQTPTRKQKTTCTMKEEKKKKRRKKARGAKSKKAKWQCKHKQNKDGGLPSRRISWAWTKGHVGSRTNRLFPKDKRFSWEVESSSSWEVVGDVEEERRHGQGDED